MRQLLTIFVALICLWATGCSSGMLKPEGRLLKKGAPFVVGEGEVVHVTFFPDEEQPEHDPYPARINNADGTFQVLGNDGKGLPPGKYRASVQIIKNRKDTLNGAYGRTRSPFKIDLTPETREITLDLDPDAAAAAPPQSSGSQRRDQRRR